MKKVNHMVAGFVSEKLREINCTPSNVFTGSEVNENLYLEQKRIDLENFEREVNQRIRPKSNLTLDLQFNSYLAVA